jgi:topoisomerase-4 subunit B
VGTKAVNALSSGFQVQSFRDGQTKRAEFEQGELVKDHKLIKSDEPNGTQVRFRPDPSIFKNYRFKKEHLEGQLWNYAYLNAGLKIIYNGTVIQSKNGLLDLLERKTRNEVLRYPIIHMKGEDVEISMSHGNHYGEQYYCERPEYDPGRYPPQRI